jgi:hypothetical protein
VAPHSLLDPRAPRKKGKTMKPKFVHNCDRCVFLGTESGADDHYDLYFCRQTGTIPTAVARYGDEPWEYQSGLEAQHIPQLQIAQRWAKERGLL